MRALQSGNEISSYTSQHGQTDRWAEEERWVLPNNVTFHVPKDEQDGQEEEEENNSDESKESEGSDDVFTGREQLVSREELSKVYLGIQKFIALKDVDQARSLGEAQFLVPREIDDAALHDHDAPAQLNLVTLVTPYTLKRLHCWKLLIPTPSFKA